jgi:hypothetical protein
MIYAMIKMDGHETLCIGGKIVPDDAKPGFLWITSLQGEKILSVDARNYRAITETEAIEHLKQAHARREAAGEAVEIAVVQIKKQHEEMEQAKKTFSQPPPFPRGDKPWNN